MSIPNMISLARILITPIFVRMYLEGEQTAAMWLLAAAAVSDMLDGLVARRFNMITPLGKVLDPVADKLLQLAMLLCLVRRSAGVIWLLLLHVLREGGLFLLGTLVYRRSGELIGSRWYGKLCTALMYSVLGAALLWQNMPEKILETGLMLCAGMIVLCMVLYTGEYLRLLRRTEEKRA